MKPEEQRIAIAEACGYIRKPHHEAVWVKDGMKIFTVGNLPDYLNDLNAMAEAEEILDEDLLDSYSHNVLKLVAYNQPYVEGGYCEIDLGRLLTATARQKAEAFLKTLNIWVK